MSGTEGLLPHIPIRKTTKLMQAARNNNRRKQSVTLRLWRAEIGELSLCRHSIDHQPTHQTIYLPDQRHMHNIFNMLSSSIAFFMGYVLLGELNFAQRQSVTLPRQHSAYVDELRLRRHRPSVGVKNCKSQLARTTSSVRHRDGPLWQDEVFSIRSSQFHRPQ